MDLTEAHIDKARSVARVIFSRYNLTNTGITWDDLFSEALLYLLTASRNWRGESDFDTHAWYSMDRGVKKYIEKERNRTRIAKFFSYDIEAGSDEGSGQTFLDTLADPTNHENLIMARFMLYEIIEALKQEKPIVTETVFRLGTDTEIAERHGLKDMRSVVQFRTRFFRDFMKAYDSGEPYKSTARERKPLAKSG